MRQQKEVSEVNQKKSRIILEEQAGETVGKRHMGFLSPRKKSEGDKINSSRLGRTGDLTGPLSKEVDEILIGRHSHV